MAGALRSDPTDHARSQIRSRRPDIRSGGPRTVSGRTPGHARSQVRPRPRTVLHHTGRPRTVSGHAGPRRKLMGSQIRLNRPRTVSHQTQRISTVSRQPHHTGSGGPKAPPLKFLGHTVSVGRPSTASGHTQATQGPRGSHRVAHARFQVTAGGHARSQITPGHGGNWQGLRSDSTGHARSHIRPSESVRS